MGGKGSGYRKVDGKPNNPNPDIGRYAPNAVRPESNERAIEFVLEYMSWPAVDLADAEAVRQRVRDYLALCAKYETKPLIAGLCVVLGSNRGEVFRWSHGERTSLGEKLSPESAEVIKNSLENLEVLWEFAMQNDGYRNPVTGIFLAKNNFGYKDTSETIIKHESAAQGPTKAQLEAKYGAALPAEDVVVVKPDEPKGLKGGEG